MEEFPLTFRFILVLLLLGINSFFSAAEVALVSVRRTRIRARADKGERRAQAVLELIDDPDRMLSATQLGVTLASLGLGWAAESVIYPLVEPWFRGWLPEGNDQVGHVLAFAVGFSLITYFHMVVGEVVPKTIALERAEKLSLAVSTPLQWFARATGFFVSLVEGTAERICRLIGLKSGSDAQHYTTEELKLLFSANKSSDEATEQRARILHRVLDFYDVTVREVMVPRQEMIALPLDAAFDQLVESLERHRHTRIPVYEGSREHIVGVVFSKELWSFVRQIGRWEKLGRPSPRFVLSSFLNEVPFVPETKFLHELLEEFQRRRLHMAMVVDEFGTVVGLVTLEDALEQIVGEIRDEHESPKPGELQPIGTVLEVDGITNIRDLAALYHVELPYDAGFETLAGFLLSKLGRIPQGGESVVHQTQRFTVLKMSRNRIASVRIEPLPPTQAETPADAEDTPAAS